MAFTLTVVKTVLSTLFFCVLFFLSPVVVGPYSTERHLAPYLMGSEMSDEVYTIMFDAGSTGSRMHLHRFTRNSERTNISVVCEYFEQVKPGLSGYVQDPNKAADSIQPLLEKAKNLIPEDKWYSAVVNLKATAGLRQLPERASTAILDSIEDLFKNSPFVVSPDSVGILDGEDEGLFGWFTVNFLLGHLNNGSDYSESVVVLDLGGGSTQITFVPLKLDTIVYSPKHFIVKKTIMDKSVYLYSHSYLGLGLMTARLAILQPEKKSDMQEVLESPCFPRGIKAKWKINSEVYYVSGTAETNDDAFQNCYNLSVNLFSSRNVHKPKEIRTRPIYAVSYYVDTMVDVGFIRKKEGCQVVTVGDYLRQAKFACENPRPDHPFLCVDLMYMYSLLHLGFGLSPEQEVTLVGQLHGFEVSWPLGAAFTLLP